MDEKEQKVLSDIETYGCHVIHVFAEEGSPCFTYSIGINNLGKPDLIITGLKRKVAHWAINEYCRRVKAGESFQTDAFYDGFLEGFKVTFKEVEKKHYENYLGWGLWYYKGDNFKMYQMIFPTTSGIWPWDKNVSEDFLWFQPLLNAS